MSKPRSEGTPVTLDEIGKAVESPKVDPFLAADFCQRRSQADFNPETEEVSLLLSTSEETEIPGKVLSRIGNIYALTTTFNRIPEIVNNENVLIIEGGRQIES